MVGEKEEFIRNLTAREALSSEVVPTRCCAAPASEEQGLVAAEMQQSSIGRAHGNRERPSPLHPMPISLSPWRSARDYSMPASCLDGRGGRAAIEV